MVLFHNVMNHIFQTQSCSQLQEMKSLMVIRYRIPQLTVCFVLFDLSHLREYMYRRFGFLSVKFNLINSS